MYIELQLDQEYIYTYGSQFKNHNRSLYNVTFRVIGKTSFAYYIKYISPKPSWLSDDMILFNSSMHLLSVPV